MGPPIEKNKIITVTANTAIDNYIEVNNLSAGTNMIAEYSMEFASGKGINVSKALETLGYPVITLGFAGSKSLSIFDEISSEFLLTDFTIVDGKTRINITIFDPTAHSETHIRTAGFSVKSYDCDKLIEKISSHIITEDIVVLSGSLPVAAPSDFYKTIIEVCHQKSAIPFLDGSGSGLVQGMKASPFLIKPNQQEFEQLVGRSFSDENEIADAARKLINNVTRLIIVSRGSKGALIIDDHSATAASVDCSFLGTPVSNIGCGDSMVAGFAVAKLRGYDLQEAIKLGVSCGVANLFSIEPGRFDVSLLSQIHSRIVIRKL